MKSMLAKLVAVGIGAAVVRSMLKAAEQSAQAMRTPGVGDFFPQGQDINAMELSRTDDPEALGMLMDLMGLGCNDGMGCADGMGCNDGLGYASNIFNDPNRIRQGFEGGRNLGVPTRAAPTGQTSLANRTGMGLSFSRPAPNYGATRFGAVYMPAHQWGLRGIGDDGLGFSLKKSIKKVFKAPTQVLKKITAPVKKVVAKVNKAAGAQLKKVANLVKRDISKVTTQARRDLKNIVAPVKRDFSNALTLLRSTDPLFKKLAPLKPQELHDEESGEVEYLDANGNHITEAEYNQQQAEADAYDQMIAAMEATAPGEVQFEESSGLYWSQDGAGNWYQWDDASKTWKQDAGTVVTDPEQTGGDSYQEEAAAPGDSLPDGVFYDAGTQLYWTQDDSGAWYYFDQGTGQFIKDADPDTEQAPAYSADNDQEQAYLDQIAAQESGAGQDVEGFWDEGTQLYWYQDPDGSWWWWADAVQEWQPDAPIKPTVAEKENGNGGHFLKWLFDWKEEGLGNLTLKASGNQMYLLRQLGNSVEEIPLKADKHGKVYATIGGGLGCLGCVDDLAGAEGLGFKLFGRTWGKVYHNVDNIAKDVASKTTVSGAVYKYVKKNDPTVYKAFHKTVHDGMPYVLIAAGTALTVASVGTATPAGAALIAAGVAEAGAQGYSDYVKHESDKAIEKANDDYDEAVALESAGRSAVNADYTTPYYSLDWWMGNVDPDQRSLLTVGEQV